MRLPFAAKRGDRVGVEADDDPHPARFCARRWMPFALAALGLLMIAQSGYIHAKALLAQMLLHRAFAATLLDGRPHKPWPWADMVPVSRIEVPRLGRSAIVLGGASGQSLAFGPAEVTGTPIIAGHRDTHFAFMGELRAGDEIRLTRADGDQTAYRVTRMEIADSSKGALSVPDPARELVLVTCYPLDARLRGPYRYLVHAEVVR
jgi:sortase A